MNTKIPVDRKASDYSHVSEKKKGNVMFFLNHIFLIPTRHYLLGILFGQVIEEILKMPKCYNNVFDNSSVGNN